MVTAPPTSPHRPRRDRRPIQDLPRGLHLTPPPARPGHGTDPATGIRRTASQQRAHAFTALLEHLDPAALPTHGGLATTLVVTMPLPTLQSPGSAPRISSAPTIDLSPGEARRLACTAGLVPAVLGTKSEVLDLGRTTRPVPRQNQLAHPRCRAEGATQRTEPHTPASRDILLCHWHHQRAHDPRYTTTRTLNGDLRYHRRR